jgi:Cytochrome c7 and related cytochrome c
MSAIFRPSANIVTQVVLLGLGTLVAGGLIWWWAWPRMDYVRHRSWIVKQPVPFSHQHHVAGPGIDCRFCHVTVETAGNAGLPPTYTCMTCHSRIWTNAEPLAPVRESLANNTPIVWHRVTDLPDYVYFNHKIHIAKGVGCESCHGTIQDMALTEKTRTLTMGFCLDCHRDPGPNLRPPEAIFNTAWHRTPDTPSTADLLKQYHVGGRNLTDCSICHR